MPIRLLLLGPFLLLMAPAAQAACSRADVDHFLARGFSQEQIVLLCGGDVRDTPTPVADEAVTAERALRDLLLRSVDAPYVDLSGPHLEWRDKVCLEYAQPNLAGRPRQRCGLVTRRLQAGSFAVEGFERQVLFFGNHGVVLAGQIQQRWDMPMDDLHPADQQRLREAMSEEAGSALLPLHASVEPAEVAAALERWSDSR